MLISLKNIHKTYLLDKVAIPALRNVCLDIDAGEFLCLMGPSGSGKSTMLHILGCIEHPSSGEVRIRGEDTRSMNDTALSRFRNRHIGFIFQSFNLVSVLNVRENVEFPLMIRGGTFDRVQVDSVIESVGLADFMKHRPDELSGGQRQRVAMPSGAVNAVDFTVSGSIGNQLEELENALVVIPLGTAQALLDLPGSVDTLIIMLTDSTRIEMMEDELRACCHRYGLELRRWDDLVPYYEGASAFYSSAMDVAGIVILAIVVFSIVNTLLMAVYDRMREFGTMRAVGTRSGQVLRIIGTESVLLALAGCAAGLVIALIAASLINAAGGIPLPPPPGNTRAYRGMIYLDASDAVRYGTLFVLVACAASLVPAVKAVRCSIADTLRWV